MEYHRRDPDGLLKTACGIPLDQLQEGESVDEWHRPVPQVTCPDCLGYDPDEDRRNFYRYDNLAGGVW